MDYIHDTKLYAVIRIEDNASDISSILRIYYDKYPEQFNQLNRICERVDLADRLNYISLDYVFNPNSHTFNSKPRLYYHHFQRLSVYLLLTCIEILYNYQKSYMSPFKFMKEILKKEEAIDINNKKYLDDLFKKAENQYNNKFGLRRGFIEVIKSLPIWFKEWISSVFFIENDDQGRPIFFKLFLNEEIDWFTLSIEDKIERISKYLYDHERSIYTHTVIRKDHLEDYSHKFSIPIDNSIYKFIEFTPKPNSLSKINIGIKDKYFESDIIKSIIIFYIRNEVGFMDNESILDTLKMKFDRKKSIFNLVWEIRRNINQAHYWSSFDRIYQGSIWQIDRMTIKEFDINMLNNCIDKFENHNYKEQFIRYKFYIDSINKIISNFNSISKNDDYYFNFINFINSIKDTIELREFIIKSQEMIQLLSMVITQSGLYNHCC